MQVLNMWPRRVCMRCVGSGVLLQVQLLLQTIELLKTKPSLVDISIPRVEGIEPKITVCGDTHGQFCLAGHTHTQGLLFFARLAHLILTRTTTCSSRPQLLNARRMFMLHLPGQFYDLCNIFGINGLPSPTNPYLFNGDFVDRGSFGVENMLTLFSWQLLYPRVRQKAAA